MRKILIVFISIILLAALPVPARAQGGPRLSLYSLQIDSFPTVSASLDVFDAAGTFVTGLAPDAVTLLEDDQPRQLTSLVDFQPGTEFTLALDPGPYFAYRDANAVTRLDKVVQTLKDWAAAHPDSLDDDLSFLPTRGTPAVHLASSASFSEALTAYQPDLQNLVSSPETLSTALDVVTEPTPRPGRKPIVLYISSIPAVDDIPILQNLTQRAVSGHIRVHVWIVASQDFFSTSGATALKDLAIQTGGQVVLFSGGETLPDLEMYLAPLRHAYRLEYSSALRASGEFALTAQVSLDGEAVASTALPFKLEILPPNPILVSPPAQIVRTAPDERTTEPSAFLPTRQEIEIIIEFPDGRVRPLVRTALYVDAVLADENSTSPFDQFTWDLGGVASSGQHILTVEAADNLGLSKTSLGIPVLVTVVRPQVGLLPWLSRNSLWVALGAILFAGGGLGLILSHGRGKKDRPAAPGRGSRHDPLTQSVLTAGKTGRLRLPWRRSQKPSGAYLVRLKDDGQSVTAPPIPINQPEITFGSDPIRATRILDDPSVSPLHARLKQEHGEYILSDEKSVAGTWVNYEQVTAPRRLKHGDVLHMGRLSYRFMLHRPPERPGPQVISLKK